MPTPLLAETMRRAEQAGFNLAAATCAERYDKSQPPERRARSVDPDCGTALVLACGGRHFWECMQRESGTIRPPAPGYHPVHRYTEQKVSELQRFLRAEGHDSKAIYPDDKQSLNFMQLAEAAGLGTVSPVICMLLHPEYGPWVSLRAALLMPGRPFGDLPDASLKESFQPCLTCHRPCLDACPVQVYDGRGGADLEACALHRHTGNCATGCEVRRACPVGADQRFGPEEERHRHAYSLFTMRKHFGLGAWRFVPRALRQ